MDEQESHESLTHWNAKPGHSRSRLMLVWL